MDTLPTAEGALQQEKFQKLVKNCPKSKYIEFFYEICDLQRDLVVEEDETEQFELTDLKRRRSFLSRLQTFSSATKRNS